MTFRYDFSVCDKRGALDRVRNIIPEDEGDHDRNRNFKVTRVPFAFATAGEAEDIAMTPLEVVPRADALRSEVQIE